MKKIIALLACLPLCACLETFGLGKDPSAIIATVREDVTAIAQGKTTPGLCDRAERVLAVVGKLPIGLVSAEAENARDQAKAYLAAHCGAKVDDPADFGPGYTAEKVSELVAITQTVERVTYTPKALPPPSPRVFYRAVDSQSVEPSTGDSDVRAVEEAMKGK